MSMVADREWFESPESTSIAQAEYDRVQCRLSIWFKTKTDQLTRYDYEGIPPLMWEEFQGAASRGTYFSLRIRPLYAGVRAKRS